MIITSIGMLLRVINKINDTSEKGKAPKSYRIRKDEIFFLTDGPI